MNWPEVIASIDASLDRVTDWTQDTSIPVDGALAFVGTADGWRFLIVDFDTESQGFPPGSRGHDGTATNTDRNLISRLTREQAKRCAAAARIKLGI